MASAGPVMDNLSVFYLVLVILWTSITVSCAGFLLLHHKTCALLRVRNIPLSLAACALLHCYWVSVQLGYAVGPVMPEDAEYWIMGTWLPLGMGLFHGSNWRFLWVAAHQKRLLTEEPAWNQPKKSWWEKLSHTGRVILVVGAGLVVQILVTVLMYIISRKWHSSWGIPGTQAQGSTHDERMHDMARGWEWWPTVFWQCIWAWIVAPIILWRSRHIRDTQGWRMQTMGCCLASLHATPMWLIALYVPAMEKVNQYFIPPQWIALSIMLIEIFTILLPCYETIRHRAQRSTVIANIGRWETKDEEHYQPSDTTNSIDSSSNSSSGSMLSMGALEHVLESNPTPLLQFSALRDFSGENIAFLTAVASWRDMLPGSGRRLSFNIAEKLVEDLNPNTDAVYSHFNRALRIYTDYISPSADFQVNLPSTIFRRLHAVFEIPARTIYGEKQGADLSTMWDTPRSMPSDGSEGVRVQYWGTIPADYDEGLFDEAEANIKYLVLTNTWSKFVKERRMSIASDLTGAHAVN
ncbi:uncharacterized protein J7T54_007621 [Emericellopsis cladophorae]|uniref:RGS domain-containing protein n=1 Tax=Emericellopsis cladophorae TaxID=2686198 RepID=A0A9P9XWF5_9HYPO|nr:uncharacterized protein J7T54_007621 [Emericellopsis cladophorae]KAI6778680.1 hypothetical protein J7T54_007621 [Emericellopsis cladophorae]